MRASAASHALRAAAAAVASARHRDGGVLLPAFPPSDRRANAGTGLPTSWVCLTRRRFQAASQQAEKALQAATLAAITSSGALQGSPKAPRGSGGARGTSSRGEASSTVYPTFDTLTPTGVSFSRSLEGLRRHQSRLADATADDLMLLVSREVGYM